MPDRLRMFALTPCQRMTMNAAPTATGSAMTATSAERRWNRNSRQTSATAMNSSANVTSRWAIERSISLERS
jgi:hypothetical protein